MLYGIVASPLPVSFPGAPIFASVCQGLGAPPCFVGAIAWRESLSSLSFDDATAYIEYEDGAPAGHGIMQLTSEFPAQWNVPATNITYAIMNFILPDLRAFAREGLCGDDLAKVAACAYNAGPRRAWAAHLAGDADTATTGGDYGSAVVGFMHKLLQGEML